MGGGTGTATTTKIHKGAPRRYWCPHFLDDRGRVVQEVVVGREPGCYTVILGDGEPVPSCPQHGKPMRKPRFKRVEDRRLETLHNAKFSIGQNFFWSDEAVRKAKCHLCTGQIERGERRIAIETANPRAVAMGTGGIITRTRRYVHAACFIDMVFGGEAGDGCPGCSAKILHDEFMEIKKMLEGRVSSGE